MQDKNKRRNIDPIMKFSKDLPYIVFLNENKEEQKTEVK